MTILVDVLRIGGPLGVAMLITYMVYDRLLKHRVDRWVANAAALAICLSVSAVLIRVTWAATADGDFEALRGTVRCGGVSLGGLTIRIVGTTCEATTDRGGYFEFSRERCSWSDVKELSTLLVEGDASPCQWVSVKLRKPPERSDIDLDVIGIGEVAPPCAAEGPVPAPEPGPADPE